MTKNEEANINVQSLRDYLEKKGITTSNGDSYFYKNYYFCHIQHWEDGRTVIFYGDKNQQEDLECIVTDEAMKGFMRENAKICKGECGCKTWPRGGSPTLFGKTFESVCSSYYIFMNPDVATIANIKRIVDLTIIAADMFEKRKIKWKMEQERTPQITDEEIDNMFPCEKAVNIKLTSMETKNWAKAEHENGLMTLKNKDSNRGRAHTQQKFGVPIKIAARIKISDAHFEIMFGKGSIKFYREKNKNELHIFDISNGENQNFINIALPVEEFFDIEWICAKNFMVIRVNGEIKYTSKDNDYIYAGLTDIDFVISSPVSVCCYKDSTVKVESLKITEA